MMLQNRRVGRECGELAGPPRRVPRRTETLLATGRAGAARTSAIALAGSGPPAGGPLAKA
jgi:hypothetical protein